MNALRRKKKIEEPVYKILDVSKIEVGKYQREINMSRVRQYAKEFDWNLFGVPLVSLRDEKFFSVDGQHRNEILKLVGVDRVMCQVLSGLSYEEEADIFVKINSKRGGLTSNQKFHGRVEAKDAVALHLVDVLARQGFVYAKNAGSGKDNCIAAIACVESIYNKFGDAHLERVLGIFRKAWCGSSASLKRDFLQGVSIFLNETKNVRDDILCSALERVTPGNLELQAHVFAGNSVSGAKEMYVYVAKAIRDIYNEYKQAIKKTA